MDNERLMIEPIKNGIDSIVRIGRNKFCKAEGPLLNHVHKGCIEICYLYKGQQSYIYNNKREYILTGGDIFIAYPGDIHGSGIQPEQKSVLYWFILDVSQNNFLGYNNKDSEQLLQAINSMKKRYFRGSEELKIILDDIIDIYINKKPFYNIRVKNLMTEVIIKVLELEKLDYVKNYSEDIVQCINYINANIEKKFILKELANKLNLSLSRFKQKFKNQVGIPPNEYIQRCKIKKAIELLKNTDSTITEIALMLNYCSSQYFCDTFKKYTKYSPSTIRKKNNIFL